MVQGKISGSSHAFLLLAMTVPQFLYHLANFVLPALALAVLMPLAGRWLIGQSAMSWPRRMLCHAAAGLAVLLAGLWVQGHDGRMATYGALVLVAGTLEWALHRGWRR